MLKPDLFLKLAIDKKIVLISDFLESFDDSDKSEIQELILLWRIRGTFLEERQINSLWGKLYNAHISYIDFSATTLNEALDSIHNQEKNTTSEAELLLKSIV